MITLEKAKETAQKINPKMDAYYEYPDAYWFCISKPTKADLWDNAVIIKKKDGKLMTMFEYTMTPNYASIKPSLKQL